MILIDRIFDRITMIEAPLYQALNELNRIMFEEDDEELGKIAQWFVAADIEGTPTEFIGTWIDWCKNFDLASVTDEELRELYRTFSALHKTLPEELKDKEFALNIEESCHWAHRLLRL